jgi:16S rRNA (cytosine1402-N4)-methyltransferase
MQLDEVERGFSYAKDAYLDMRMDQSKGQTAADLLALLDVSSLARIFRSYGEEKFALPIAKRIAQKRAVEAISTSSSLNRIVSEVVPAVPGKQSGHPAKRVYQALRIAVNDELGVLERAMPQAIDALVVGGRLVVMSYHSLEDGFVKEAMQKAASSRTPVEMPVELPGMAANFKILTRGVERASERELEINPRAASARLRAGEKLEGN